MAGEYGSFGDTTDTRVLAERLDEGLHAVDLLWSGEPVTYRGNQITINDVVFLPAPVQRPRVPIWVGGFWPNKAPMRRAARWDLNSLPVPADLLVYTDDEWRMLIAGNSRFARMLGTEVCWL